MKKLTPFLLSSLLALAAYSQQGSKHALLIGISQYQDKTWETTAGENDVNVVYQLLKMQGFPEDNIAQLKNERATKNAILTAISTLLQRIRKGDVVVIYFSGHGNTLPDNDGDETSDGYDEAIAPFDAPCRAASPNYILDDTVHEWMRQIGSELGGGGHLLFIFDSCYSGEANRNGRSFYKGGSSAAPIGSSASQKDAAPHDLPSGDVTLAPWVFFAACQSDESAGHTSAKKESSLFTHELVDALTTGEKVLSYRQLKGIVEIRIASKNFPQTPWLAGNAETGVFGGAYKPLPTYCRVVEHKIGTRVKINGWPLIHAKVGGEIVFYPITTGDTLGVAPFATGIITKLEVPVATVELDTPKSQGENIMEMKAMLRGDHQPKTSVSLPKGMERLEEAFGKAPFIDLNSDSPELMFERSGDSLKLFRFDGRLLGAFPIDATPTSLLARIKMYIAAQQLRELKAEADYCDISAVLRSGEAASSPAFPANSSHKDGDTVWLHITNNTDNLVYYNVVEIQARDTVTVLYPYKDFSPERCSIGAKKSIPLKIILYPPGGDLLKVIATTGSSFDLSKETQDASRGVGNPSRSGLDLIRNTFAQTRGSDGISQKLDIETLTLTILPK